VPPELGALTLASDPGRWRELGFCVEDGGTCAVGTIRLELRGQGTGRGILSWAFRDVAPGRIDGLETHATDMEPAEPVVHPNSTATIDHVVVMSKAPERTVGAFQDAGFHARWTNHGQSGMRQTFFRAGEAVLELIGPEQADPRAGLAHFYGIAFAVDDIDATAAFLGARLGPVKDALQPGRRIATLRKEAGAGIAVAFMSPGRAAA